MARKSKLKYINGYPSQGTIRNFLINYGVEPFLITFSADYAESTRTAILWTNSKVKSEMVEFEQYLTDRGILISCSKYQGHVHSIYFLQDKSKL
jgi:hypothetical protein